MTNSTKFSARPLAMAAEGPWGQKGKPTPKPRPSQQPTPAADEVPDLEKLWQDTQQRLLHTLRGGRGGNGGGNGDGTPPGGSGDGLFGYGKKFWQLVGGGVALLWLISGFYIVAPDEQGVVTTFGNYSRTAGPGPNYRLPWPFEQVQIVRVTSENILQVGFRTETGGLFSGGDPASVGRDVPSESQMLTGDENIIDLDFTVRWRVADPEQFLFNVADPEQTIRDLAESAMREVIGRNPIDEAFNNRGLIQVAAKEVMTAVVARYGLGIEITGLELQQVNPPQEVLDAFRDVQAAQADAEKAQNQAQGYANDILPRARGEAAQMIQAAEAYKAARVAEAQGLADRFASQRAAYAQAPEVTRRRIYLETMEEVIQKANVIMVSNPQQMSVLPYLNLPQLNRGAAAATATTNLGGN